jgi:hypothetical protein|tara:strand:+ start:271 stop:516 length:246 start_codon:yes stop_codon:yes gene_type:complete
MVKLKEYIDFVTSLVEMDEVKNGKFVLPTHMDFQLEMLNHRELRKEVSKIKKENVSKEDLVEPFEVNILGVTLKFEHIGYE